MNIFDHTLCLGSGFCVAGGTSKLFFFGTGRDWDFRDSGIFSSRMKTIFDLFLKNTLLKIQAFEVMLFFTKFLSLVDNYIRRPHKGVRISSTFSVLRPLDVAPFTSAILLRPMYFDFLPNLDLGRSTENGEVLNTPPNKVHATRTQKRTLQ